MTRSLSVCIVHMFPIEFYPPAINVINYLNEQYSNAHITVFTTEPSSTIKRYQPPVGRNTISVIRYPVIGKGGKFTRLTRYFRFYLNVLLKLKSIKPGVVLYYETISSLPAVLYKKWLNQHVRLIAHYHEYISIEEFERGPALVRTCWNIERKNFKLINTISHTNEMRLDMFKKDHAGTSFSDTIVLPNYPPGSWAQYSNVLQPSEKEVVRMVYVGYGLSTETMYSKEFFKWIAQQQGTFQIDCYVQSVEEDVKEFLTHLSCEWITIKPPVNYFELPQVLRQYQLGIIMYKGHIPNCVYIAPNKLFEYLACELDVWFPAEMKGSLEYVNTGSRPKVLAIDFNNLPAFDWKQALDHAGLPLRDFTYYYENTYHQLLPRISPQQ
jgi:hypothetical protein